jgi:transcriptional regulator
VCWHQPRHWDNNRQNIVYRPKAFSQSEPAELVEFMRAHSFAVLVAIQDGRPVAVHVPIVVVTKGDDIVLRGHVARANSLWQSFDGDEALVIFGGPHAYVSPSAYEKRESVPTWNYMAVHAYGVPHAIHATQASSMSYLLAELIDTYEASYGEQWNSLPQTFREGLMQGIVGFELPVARLEGQYKLSQNRSVADRHNVATMLSAAPDASAAAVGSAMQRNLASASQPSVPGGHPGTASDNVT